MLSAAEIESYERDGFLVVDDFVSADDRDRLRGRALDIVDAWEPSEQRSVFTTNEQARVLDDEFERFSYDPRLAEIASDIGIVDARALQSMYIFKQPHIGGEVGCHQDATFLYTDPITVTGFWFAIEDATLDNGCLWAAPGGHRGPLRPLG